MRELTKPIFPVEERCMIGAYRARFFPCFMHMSSANSASPMGGGGGGGGGQAYLGQGRDFVETSR